MINLSSNELEAANRAEATVLLIRAGFRVYRPEADVHGEDLILRDPRGDLRVVQLKSRPWVDWNRYGRREIWMLFPNPAFRPGRDWFLLEHDELFAHFQEAHGHAPGWQANLVWTVPKMTRKLRAYLEPYSQAHWSPNGLSKVAPEDEPSDSNLLIAP